MHSLVPTPGTARGLERLSIQRAAMANFRLRKTCNLKTPKSYSASLHFRYENSQAVDKDEAPAPTSRELSNKVYGHSIRS